MSADGLRPIQLTSGILLGDDAFPIIAGPCVIEDEQLVFGVAEALLGMAERLGLSVIFKASYDKANRSSISSFRGPGLEEGLKILSRVKEKYSLPILSDVHLPSQCAAAAEVCDVLQIPAFLCRQTDLLVAAAETGRAVNIKKGQFVAPADMLKAVDKARGAGAENVCVTERGYSFGYNNMVVDMRSFAMMQADGIPVIYDATHSLQLPGGGEITGGAREFAEPLARAAVAAGADGIFVECHPNPEKALSDATTQLPPARVEALLSSLLRVRAAVTAPQQTPKQGM